MNTYQKYIKGKDSSIRNSIGPNWNKLIGVLPEDVRPVFTITKGYSGDEVQTTFGIRMVLKLPGGKQLVVNRPPDKNNRETTLVSDALREMYSLYMSHLNKEKQKDSKKTLQKSEKSEKIEEITEDKTEEIEKTDEDAELEALLEADSKAMVKQIKVSKNKKEQEERQKQAETARLAKLREKERLEMMKNTVVEDESIPYRPPQPLSEEEILMKQAVYLAEMMGKIMRS
jgi:hypothetical protein